MWSFSKADFKEKPVWSIAVFATLMYITWITGPNLLKLDLICTQISLTIIIFDRNEGYCREIYVSVIHFYKFQILVLLIIFEVLFPTCQLTWSWILVSSNICQERFKLTFPTFSCSFDLEPVKTKTALFPKPCWLMLTMWHKPQRNHNGSRVIILVPVAVCPVRWPETFSLQSREIPQIVPDTLSPADDA